MLPLVYRLSDRPWAIGIVVSVMALGEGLTGVFERIKNCEAVSSHVACTFYD